MDFLIKNTKGLTLKTKGKYCTEDLVIEIDPSLVEGYMEVDELPEVGLPRVLYKLMLEEPEYYIWENDEWLKLNTKGGGGLIEVTELPEVGEEDVVYKLVSGGTPIPTSGYVEKIYVNLNLQADEVISILDTLDYIMQDGHSFPIHLIFSNADKTKNISVVKMETTDGDYLYQIAYEEKKGTTTTIHGIFQFDKFFEITEEGYTIDDTAVSELSGVKIGTKNEKLANLISTTNKFGNYEVDYFMYKNDEWVKINVANIVKQVSTQVPNTGYVETVYFNTSLSNDKVRDLLKELTYNITPFLAGVPISPLLFASDGNPVVFAQYIGNNYAIIVATDIANKVFEYAFTYDEGDPQGTNGFKMSEYSINKEVIAEYSGLPIGTENNKLINLISTTPFENQVIKELSGDYEAVELEVTENTTVDVSAMLDEGKMPMSINVNVEPNLQEKEITENGEYVADEGYDGFSKVTVNVGGSGSGGIIEVDELPTENIQEDVVYKIKYEFKDILMVSNGQYGFLSDSYALRFKSVDVKPTENINVSSIAYDYVYLYYVSSENELFVYVNVGAGEQWYSFKDIYYMLMQQNLSFKGEIYGQSENLEDGYYIYYGEGNYYKYMNNEYSLVGAFKNVLSDLINGKYIKKIEITDTQGGLYNQVFNSTNVDYIKINSNSVCNVPNYPNGFVITENAFYDSKVKTIHFYHSNRNAYPYFYANVFNYANQLKSVIFDFGTFVAIEDATIFGDTNISNGTCYIYVPDDLVDTVKALGGWSVYASQIKPLSEYVEE